MSADIIDLYLKDMTEEEAKEAIEKELSRVSSLIYRIRLIHGYDGEYGVAIRDMVFDEYDSSVDERVCRVEPGWNYGITELVLQDYTASARKAAVKRAEERVRK